MSKILPRLMLAWVLGCLSLFASVAAFSQTMTKTITSTSPVQKSPTTMSAPVAKVPATAPTTSVMKVTAVAPSLPSINLSALPNANLKPIQLGAPSVFGEVTDLEAMSLCGAAGVDLSSPATVDAIKASMARLFSEMLKKKMEAYQECIQSCSSSLFEIDGSGNTSTGEDASKQISVTVTELMGYCQQNCAKS